MRNDVEEDAFGVSFNELTGGWQARPLLDYAEQRIACSTDRLSGQWYGREKA